MSLLTSIPMLVLRLILGGIFVFAAAVKLQDPQGVADTILGFELGIPDHLVLLGAYVVPWAEMLIGVALVVGLWTRAAALLYALTMAAFIAAIISVIQRGMSLECQCLGRFKLYCSGPLGTCKVVENSILLGGALIIFVLGAGGFSLDRFLYGRRAS